MSASWQSRRVNGGSASTQLAGYPEADLPALDALISRGVDLTKPRHVLHYLYVSSRSAQIAASDRMRELGWEVSAPEPLADYPNDWLVRVERKSVTLSPELVASTRHELEVLAEQHGGDYDGWEASL